MKGNILTPEGWIHGELRFNGRIGAIDGNAADPEVLSAAAVGRARANAMALLGEKLPAAQAWADGLVTAVVEPDALQAKVDKVIDKLLAASPRALELTKQAVDAQTLAGFDLALDLEREGQIELLQSPEFAALIEAFASRGKARTPVSASNQ